ncbi:MAG: hypothetical protein DMG37_03965 [Acidobacteria bacterium]|nr:MAG: hypothetical protein DMG37_03965 [Acidobacteriota bacterium]
MNCSEAAERVSALFDGAPISRDVAAHLSDCQECRVRLNEYAEMGAELRDLAGAAAPRAIPEGRWRLAEPAAANNWLGKWRGTMRIPRLAFALMLAALLALSLSAGLFLTRAKETYRWFQYEIRGRDEKMIMRGAVPPNGEGNPYYDPGAGMTYPDGIVWFKVRMMERVGDAEKIGVRAWWVPKGENRGDERQVNMPEQEFLYSPGEELKIPVEGYGNLGIKGQFGSTLPETVRRGMYPEYGKFRIDPPVLLVHDKELLGKYISGGGELLLEGSYFAYGQQDQGWFVFSSKPIAGAVEGTLTMNQVEFTLDGKQYSLFTGDPIVFGRINIWVKHYASIRDADPTSLGDGWQGNEPRLAFGEAKNLTAEK